jgi:uncharacterized membrane protein
MSWEILLPYAAWLGNTPFAQWLGASTWRIAWLLSIHLFGLTLLLGSVIVISLNLLGMFQRSKPAERLRREVRPVLLTGLTLSLVTGALIFTGGAQPYYEGYWFRLKMVLLAVTLIFHFTVYRTVSTAPAGRFSAGAYRLTGACLLALWFGVAWAGRAIAFF